MHQIIAGVLIGVAAIMFGPRLLSDFVTTLRPLGAGLLRFGETALGTLASTVSTAGSWVSGVVGSETGKAPVASQSPPPKPASDKQEESFLQEAEELGKDVAVKLAEEEAISFIKMALIAII